MNGLGTARRARGGIPPGVANVVIGDLLKTRPDEGPAAHVERLFLTPDPLFRVRVMRSDLGDLVTVEGIELLEADDGCIPDLVLTAELKEIVVNLARAEDKAADAVLGAPVFRGVVKNLVKVGAFAELFDAGNAGWMGQQALGRHDDERLAEGPVHLPPQNVEVLGRRRDVTDLHVATGTELKEPLETGTAVLGTLAFVTVREQHDEMAGALPLRLGRGDELVDDDLSAVGEIAELRFPEDEGIGRMERVAVFEAEHGELGKVAVVNPELLLLPGLEVIERGITLTGLGIVKDGVPVAEGATATILPRKADGHALFEERSESKCLTEGPVNPGARLDRLAARTEETGRKLLVDLYV